MSVSFGAAGTVSYGSTSLTPSFPSGITIGQKLILVLGTKPGSSAVINTVSGWTGLIQSVGTNGANGVDTGPTRVVVYERTATGAETGTQSISIPSGSASWACIYRVSTTGDAFLYDAYTDQDTTSDTSYSAVSAAPAGTLQVGDFVMAIASIATDNATWSAETITAAGVTMGTVTELGEYATSTGNDIGGAAWYATVTSGTMTGTSITVGATLSTASYGPVAILRFREITVPAAVSPYKKLGGTSVTPYKLTAGGLVRLLSQGGVVPNIVGTVSGGRPIEDGITTITPPPGAVSYVAVVCYVGGTSPSFPTPAGWTEYINDENSYDPSWSKCLILKAKASDSPSFAFGWATGYKEYGIAIAGYDCDVVLSSYLKLEYNANTGSWTGLSPSITLSKNALVLRIATMNNNASSSITTTYPASATLGRTVGIGAQPDNDHALAAIAHESRGSGSTGTASWTITGSAYMPTTFSIQVSKA